MKKNYKILINIICLYVSITKIYVLLYNVINKKNDPSIFFVDLTVLCSCIFLSLLLWTNIKKIKYRIIWIILLVISIFLQIFIGLFDYLSRDINITSTKALYLFDIPNLLSIFIMMFLLILILKKKNIRLHNEPKSKSSSNKYE